MTNLISVRAILLSLISLVFLSGCTPSLNPITVVQRVVEDRSATDIAKDTEIVAKANVAMADSKVISASTIVYEQRLVVYGIVTDNQKYKKLERDVRAIDGVKKLYWHVKYMSESEKESRDAELVGLADGVAAQAKIEAEWIKSDIVSSTNFRVGIDPFGTAYVMGRGKTGKERDAALAIVRGTEDIRRVKNYSVVRP
ncbi:MAG: BON domain-containing protein [Alphaproteobacteria bacterium]|nr:BON domain-containing protein [Alphaproteobacteria bacterium]